jgi:hypothetical protein
MEMKVTPKKLVANVLECDSQFNFIQTSTLQVHIRILEGKQLDHIYQRVNIHIY